MRVSRAGADRSFCDLGVVFCEADPYDRAAIRTARLTGDLGPLLDHLEATDPDMTSTRSLLLHAALTLALVDAGRDPDSLVEDARNALALYDRAAARPDFAEHLTPPLRRQFRARIKRMIARADRFSGG
jgi:hypothetical protein